MCGELPALDPDGGRLDGSSPRVRGTRRGPRRPQPRRRFIPACAGNSPPPCSAPAPKTVHPRVCGELTGICGQPCANAGSSPRVRGTLRQDDGGDGSVRFIPACAGNSAGSTTGAVSTNGSSPRVRGTRPVGSAARGARRFIPACAGNSQNAAWIAVSPAVHPRVCGELSCRKAGHASAGGSSPRVRGTLRLRLGGGGLGRFIPACAGNSGRPTRGTPAPTVHPRVCGELGLAADAPQRADRSSPRVRGTRTKRGWAAWNARFIPACAGNSGNKPQVGVMTDGSSPRVRGTPQRDASERREAAVHPRVCGELATGVAYGVGRVGSSPRVRGTPGDGRRRRRRQRFIPACAGNSTAPTSTWRWGTVHPRVCGELRQVGAWLTEWNGSSPRVRGTHPPPSRRRGRATVHPRVCGELYPQATTPPHSIRFIPACAGNSRSTWCQAATTTVHPRVCGELVIHCFDQDMPSGSSPRVRGTPQWWRTAERAPRFIPACAGNSFRDMGFRVHDVGSSPRVRGTHWPQKGLVRRERFIPACAGNSVEHFVRFQTGSVHPRVCGELFTCVPAPTAPSGSSPRVRGTPCLRPAGDPGGRFIPACAGNSAA